MEEQMNNETVEKMEEVLDEKATKIIEKVKEERVKILSKMSSKIGYVVIAMVLVPIVIVSLMSIIKSKSTMTDTYKSYAQNLAEEAAVGVDFAVQSGEETYGKYAQNISEMLVSGVEIYATTGKNDMQSLSNVMNAAKIDGVDSSYSYMVSDQGVMMYHPTADKIGKPVENEAVKGIVADLEAGKKVENGYVIYEYDGAKKLAGYALTSNNTIIIVTADYDDFMRIDYDMLIGQMSISNVKGSYAYMVSSEGTMLYHSDSEKIGKTVENKAVKDIVSDLKKGKKVKPGAVIYDYKGEKKIAGYCLTNDNNIIVVTGDYDLFLKPVDNLTSAMVLIGVIMVIISGVIGVILVEMMMKAFGKIVPLISETANFKFKDDGSIDSLCKRKDEVGLIARKIKEMRTNLAQIVGSIENASVSIDSNVDELLGISQNVNEMCVDNSATSQQLAAGMEETSASTTTITNNISDMYDNARQIEALTVKGVRLSENVMGRASELRKNTEIATKTTMSMYSSVKEKSSTVLEASKAVSRINELTQTVMAISDQTSLLALNASIESARAGEAGRGFSVVATEISNLATQTTEAVNDINTIVLEVNKAVDGMNECLNEIIGFLEENVISDYENFGKVSIQYHDDADDFKQSMDEIKNGISNLNEMLNVVSEAIAGINETVGEAAGGVSDIAEKTSDMVNGTISTSEKVDECKKHVVTLNDIIEKFEV